MHFKPELIAAEAKTFEVKGSICRTEGSLVQNTSSTSAFCQLSKNSGWLLHVSGIMVKKEKMTASTTSVTHWPNGRRNRGLLVFTSGGLSIRECIVSWRCLQHVALLLSAVRSMMKDTLARQRRTNAATPGKKSPLLVAKGCYQCPGGGVSG